MEAIHHAVCSSGNADSHLSTLSCLVVHLSFTPDLQFYTSHSHDCFLNALGLFHSIFSGTYIIQLFIPGPPFSSSSHCPLMIEASEQLYLSPCTNPTIDLPIQFI